MTRDFKYAFSILHIGKERLNVGKNLVLSEKCSFPWTANWATD
jgi:hypothetical protein